MRSDPPAPSAPVLDASDLPSRRAALEQFSLGSFGSRYGLVVAWVGVAAVFSLSMPEAFLSAANLQNVFGSQGMLLLAIGLLLPLSALTEHRIVEQCLRNDHVAVG
ncbi:hypothetical protein FB384_003346 [Prauserella sediminis]|uniref:Uncharacterized protein n=1 Tax=Prauserella sediminis TaxID=577680 RepID=A0A839XKJ7_9PSEU|nr:hypothetical protein [Prauserella sediminis]MBB3664442.1 hypothetical protein [Prauserella sediminis]